MNNMNSIFNKENELWNSLFQSYSTEEQKKFFIDGLCLSDIKNKLNLQDQTILEKFWINNDKRILFLLKEGVDQGGEDYRDYLWESEKCQCKIKPNLRETLWYLNNLQSNPPELDINERVFEKYPFAIVNLKKLSRIKVLEGSESNWKELRSFANRDRDFLKNQIRNILAPNIIVCCGCDNQDSVIAIALELIYDDIHFKEFKIGEELWCKYNLENNLFLLNSYHLSSSNFDISKLINAFKAFIIELFEKNYLKKNRE